MEIMWDLRLQADMCFCAFIFHFGSKDESVQWRQISGTTTVAGSSSNCIRIKNNNLRTQTVIKAFLLKINCAYFRMCAHFCVLFDSVHLSYKLTKCILLHKLLT